MQIILKTFKLGDPKYFAGVSEVPMGFAVVLSPVIFGAVTIDSDEDAKSIIEDFPEYEFEVSMAEFGCSENLMG